MTSRATPALRRSNSNSSGITLIELLVVIALLAIMCAITLPQLISSGRAIGSAGIPREIIALLRHSRQQAISQKTVHTCRYDDMTKKILIINHGESGITHDPATDTMVKLPGNAAASADLVTDVIVEELKLERNGILANDIVHGRLDGVATVELDDGTDMTTLTATNVINFTFQPDGSIVNSANNPVNRTLFLYNSHIQNESAFAISVLGTTGRIKLWRYDSNANKYSE